MHFQREKLFLNGLIIYHLNYSRYHEFYCILRTVAMRNAKFNYSSQGRYTVFSINTYY